MIPILALMFIDMVYNILGMMSNVYINSAPENSYIGNRVTSEKEYNFHSRIFRPPHQSENYLVKLSLVHTNGQGRSNKVNDGMFPGTNLACIW